MAERNNWNTETLVPLHQFSGKNLLYRQGHHWITQKVCKKKKERKNDAMFTIRKILDTVNTTAVNEKFSLA